MEITRHNLGRIEAVSVGGRTYEIGQITPQGEIESFFTNSDTILVCFKNNTQIQITNL